MRAAPIHALKNLKESQHANISPLKFFHLSVWESFLKWNASNQYLENKIFSTTITIMQRFQSVLVTEKLREMDSNSVGTETGKDCEA